jgi:hypothetical protein
MADDDDLDDRRGVSRNGAGIHEHKARMDRGRRR